MNEYTFIHKFYVPANDIHIEKWKRDPNSFYNIKSQNKCIELMQKHKRSFNCAVDVGAWCGIWSNTASQYFKKIISFEPDRNHYECFKLNNGKIDNIKSYNFAVGKENKKISLETPEEGHTQTTRVVEGNGDIEMVVLDDVIDEKIDLLKIDAEGYEIFVLEGSHSILKDHKPAIQIEANHNTENYGFEKKEISKLLSEYGYRKMAKVWPDTIYM